MLAAAGALPLILVAACLPNKMYREVSVQEAPGHSLAFIEFDDQGELWDPKQLQRALGLIAKANQSDEGALLAIYVHGWQNNASPKNEAKGNLAGFKSLLARTADVSRQRFGGKAKPLVGIYIGWRGKASAVPLISQLSFYSRARAAKRVSGTTSSTVLLELNAALRRNPQSRAVLIGHSLGGQIVERALAPLILSGVYASTERGREIPRTLSLVILINPASSSLLAKQLVEALDRSQVQVFVEDGKGNRIEQPLIVSITAERDFVTRVAFRAGLTLSGLGKSFRSYTEDSCVPFGRQRKFYRTTAGHNSALLSHYVTAVPLAESGDAGSQTGGDLLARREFDPVTRQNVISWNGERHRFTIRRRLRALNDTPYWIMSAPRALLAGHEMAWSPDTLHLLEALMRTTGALDSESATRMEQQKGVRAFALAPLPNDELILVDASRRVYRLASARNRLEFLYCLEDVADPTSLIGFHAEPGHLLAAHRWPQADGAFRTEFVELAYDMNQAEELERKRAADRSRYLAAAFDNVGRRAFLLSDRPYQVLEVDLANKQPQPVPVTSLADAELPGTLLYAKELGGLFVLDSEAGRLLRIDVDSAEPRPRQVAADLGTPVALAADAGRNRIYVADPEGERVVMLECGSGGECTPRAELTEEEFGNPHHLAVQKDGTLWVADIGRERVSAYSPEGELLTVIDELPTDG